MAYDRKDAIFEVVNRVVDECAALSMGDQLMVLQIAWIVLAKQARDQALAFPGGFPGEQARQLEQLVKIAAFIREDTPDLELERLNQDGDFDGALKHFRSLWDDLEKGGA